MIKSRRKRKQVAMIQTVYSSSKTVIKIEAEYHYKKNNELN